MADRLLDIAQAKIRLLVITLKCGQPPTAAEVEGFIGEAAERFVE